MKKLTKASLIVLFLVIATGAFAQGDNGKVTMKLNYNIAAPVGSFKSLYVGNTSFNGGSGEIAYWFSPKASLGLNVGYQSYYQKYARQTYKLEGNQTISAVLSNTVGVMPVIVNGTYVPLANTGTKIQPYVSGGVGLNLVNYSQYFGEFSDGNSSASFAAQAGAGVMIPLGSRLNNAAFNIGANFNYMPYNKNGLSNLNNGGVNAGIVFPLK